MRDLLEMLTSVDLLVSLLSWSHQSVVVALTKATYARMKRTPAMQPSKTSLLKDQTSAHKWTRLERLLCTSPHVMPELMLLRSCWTPKQMLMLRTTQEELLFTQLWRLMLRASSRFFFVTEPLTSTPRLLMAPLLSYWQQGWLLKAWLKT